MRHFITQFNARMPLVAALLAMATPATVLSQSAAAAPKIRSWSDPSIATLMLVDDLGPSDARAVVIRRPGDLPNNIILVTRSTTAADLADAVTALIASRRNRGDQVDREMRALIGATPVGTPPASAKRGAGNGAGPTKRTATRSPSEGLSARDLKRLRSAPDFAIAGIGHGPAIVIRMKAKPRPSKG
jgi:hypothetical protein